MADTTPQDSTNESRRAFVKKAGKLAIYTPPTVMALMQPSVDAIAQSSGQVQVGDVPRYDDQSPFSGGQYDGLRSFLERLAARIRALFGN